MHRDFRFQGTASAQSSVPASNFTLCDVVDLSTLAFDEINQYDQTIFMAPRSEFLRLDFARNSGAAFSAFTGLTVVLTLLAICALVAIIWYIPRISHPLWALGFGSLTGGICGNLADRLFRAPGFMKGEVVDWIRLPNWPLFNVADSFIVTSVALMIFLSWREVPIRMVVVEDE